MGAKKVQSVGVLMGGTSSERDVSLRTGAAVANALRGLGHAVTEVDIQSETGRELDGLELDAAFIALHGRFGEDGRIQKLLQGRRIPYTGSGPEASWVAMDKVESKRLFKQKGVRMRSTRLTPSQPSASLASFAAFWTRRRSISLSGGSMR